MNRTVILIRNAKPQDFGGGERFPVFVAESLQTQGFDPVIMTGHEKVQQLAGSSGISVVKSWWWQNQNWSGKRAALLPIYVLWQIVLFFYYLIKFISLMPKAVHIQSKDDFIAGTLAARLVGARVVWTDHADLKHIWKNITVWYKNPVGKLVYKAAGHTHYITLVSNSEEAEVKTNLPKDSKILSKLTVIYNGVADQKSNYPAKKQSKFTFGVVGRLVADKGINEALEAFEIINKKYPSTQLLLVGSGPDEAKFRQKSINNPSIIFTGHQTEPLDYLAKLDVFMQPTYHEGFSVSLVEATMMQLPIIATAVGGNVEIIKDKSTGLLVGVKNSNQLAKAMERLYKDKVFADKLAKTARQQYLNNFVFDKIVKERFLPLYENDRN